VKTVTHLNTWYRHLGRTARLMLPVLGSSVAVGFAVAAIGLLHGPGGNDFCTTHVCVGSFDHGSGFVVQCGDGTWSHSGGTPDACSRHGGSVDAFAWDAGDPNVRARP
jgi:hypothetical protein